MTLSSEAVYKLDNVRSCRSEPVRALVVDDDHSFLKVVHRMLETLGCRTDSANGGRSAIRCLTQSRYDLMITDLQMPDMDGYELSGWLKNKSKDIKVIVMTGADRSEVVNYMNPGIVDRWMFKPFGLRKLAGILCELLPAGTLDRFARYADRYDFECADGPSSMPQSAYLKEC